MFEWKDTLLLSKIISNLTWWQQEDDWTAQNPHSVGHWDNHAHGSRGTNLSNCYVAHPTNGYNDLNNSSAHNPSGILDPRKGNFHVTNPMLQDYGERHFESSKISEARSAFPSGQTLPHNGGISQRSSPFTTSFSPNRYYIYIWQLIQAKWCEKIWKWRWKWLVICSYNDF